MKTACGILLGLLMLAGTVRADDATEAKALLERAIQAAGGKENLARYRARTWKEKGTYHGMGDGLPYSGTYAVQRPGQFRMVIEGVFAIVLDGDKGWVKTEDNVLPLTKEQLADHQEEQYIGNVATLLPLEDRAYTLKPTGEVKIGDRPAVGLVVSHQGHRDVRLYFDKETALLIRTEATVRSAEMGGKEVQQVADYAEYQKISGLELPMKITIRRNGKLFVEAELSEVKPLTKLDKSVFARP
jgi:outer membrane lipoprotein-sorting protein